MYVEAERKFNKSKKDSKRDKKERGLNDIIHSARRIRRLNGSKRVYRRIGIPNGLKYRRDFIEWTKWIH